MSSTWHGSNPRLLLYSIVISQGRRNDVARFLNAQRLQEDWPQLRPLVSTKMRKALERKLGLPVPERAGSVMPSPAGTGTPLRMSG